MGQYWDSIGAMKNHKVSTWSSRFSHQRTVLKECPHILVVFRELSQDTNVRDICLYKNMCANIVFWFLIWVFLFVWIFCLFCIVFHMVNHDIVFLFFLIQGNSDYRKKGSIPDLTYPKDVNIHNTPPPQIDITIGSGILCPVTLNLSKQRTGKWEKRCQHLWRLNFYKTFIEHIQHQGSL